MKDKILKDDYWVNQNLIAYYLGYEKAKNEKII